MGVGQICAHLQCKTEISICTFFIFVYHGLHTVIVLFSLYIMLLYNGLAGSGRWVSLSGHLNMYIVFFKRQIHSNPKYFDLVFKLMLMSQEFKGTRAEDGLKSQLYLMVNLIVPLNSDFAYSAKLLFFTVTLI